MDFVVSSSILALVPIIIGLVQLAKIYMNNRYAPLLSLLLGIGGAFLVTGISDIPTTLISGVVIGLTASGLYAGTKATFQYPISVG